MAKNKTSPRPPIKNQPETSLAQPELHELAKQLRFAPSEGKIWLQGRRMGLISSDTFIALRAELIETLGLDGARALLTRLFYTNGSQDAEKAWRLAGMQGTATEWLEGARFYRSLQGFGLIQPLSSFSENEAFNMEFEWILEDSLESETYIADRGVGSVPACWMEIGYSSGFFSTFAGRRILTREVDCRAMGGAHCRFIAKPVEAWPEADEELSYFRIESPSTSPDSSVVDEIVGGAAAFHVIRHKIRRVAPTNATVLLLGESGTGKSMFAQEIHRLSRRSGLPFIEVNCAAIPDTLIESELFGVERGAFSGATRSRPGRFELANGGTIFLDEISSLSFSAQSKLLRVLQNGEMERLGSTITIKCDVRVIAATNEDLRIAIKEKQFRADLFYRLNVLPITVQPLRERRDDIPLLAEAFLLKFCDLHGRQVPGITTRAMRAILDYDWPGNIRELENVIERGVILAQEDKPIDIHDIFSVGDHSDGMSPLGLSGEGSLVEQPFEELLSAADGNGRNHTIEGSISHVADHMVKAGLADVVAVEDALITAAIKETDGNIAAAARILGMTRSQIDYRMRKLRI